MKNETSYKNRELVNSAVESILSIIKPGDIIIQTGTYKWWQLQKALVLRSIQNYQKKVLGEQSNWQSTHAMLYLDENNTFSVEIPRATLKPLHEYCLSHFSIYRIQFVEMTKEFVSILHDATLQMVGEDYNLNQVVDICISDIMGYDHQRHLNIFDFGRNRKLSSVGVRVAFEYLYNKKVRREDSRPGKWLFYMLNLEKWSKDIIREYNGTNIEATTPAHFVNSDLYCHDFKLIATFSKGKQIFP